jgi:hypothetical protein
MLKGKMAFIFRGFLTVALAFGGAVALAWLRPEPWSVSRVFLSLEIFYACVLIVWFTWLRRRKVFAQTYVLLGLCLISLHSWMEREFLPSLLIALVMLLVLIGIVRRLRKTAGVQGRWPGHENRREP